MHSVYLYCISGCHTPVMYKFYYRMFIVSAFIVLVYDSMTYHVCTVHSSDCMTVRCAVLCRTPEYASRLEVETHPPGV